MTDGRVLSRNVYGTVPSPVRKADSDRAVARRVGACSFFSLTVGAFFVSVIFWYFVESIDFKLV